MSRRNLYWLLGITAISLLGFAVSYSAPSRERNENYELVRLFVDVLQEVEQKYVVELDADKKRKLAEDMINGGLERLDPHSAYLPPDEFAIFQGETAGKFGGVGVEVDFRNDYVTVIAPIEGSPAARAGIRSGVSSPSYAACSISLR